MQPTKPRKTKEKNLLDRLREKHPVELGMELKGYTSDYLLEGTRDKKILDSTKLEEFLGSAKTIQEALSIISKFEKRRIDEYDASKIQTTYVHTEEELETKIREEAMPKRFPKAKGIEMYGRRFYIVKKQPNGKSSGKIFCLYNWKTRNLIFSHHDKDMLIGFLYRRYKEIEHKDIM
jgi:hypothetical protein